MYRFALRPRWIVSHVLVAALVVSMILLCAWQLRRLHDRQDRNALIEANSTRPPGGAEVLEADPTANRYRVVSVRGTYEPDREVAIRNRSGDRGPGRWVVTPLRLPGGDAVLVLRGFLPIAIGDTDPPFDGVDPPSGEVDVAGWAQPTQEKPAIGPTDPPDGVLTEMARIDVARLASQIPGRILPMWLQARDRQSADPSADLTPVPLPELDDGPHLSYAVQWAIFTLIAFVGYPLVLRKVARQYAREARRPDGPGGPGPAGDDGDVTGDPDSAPGPELSRT